MAIVTDINQLQIGDKIICRYTAGSNQFGTFSELGTCIATEIPVTSSATPDGSFYFIYSGDDHLGRKKLVADRNIQHSISWDTLNSVGVASGNGLPISIFTLNNSDLCKNGIAFGTEYDDTGNNAYNERFIDAFDNNINSIFVNRVNDITKEIIIGYIFPLEKIITCINIYPRQGYSYLCYNNFKIQASNNTTNGFDGTWNDLITNLSTNGKDTLQSYTFSNTNSYKAYRLIGTTNRSALYDGSTVYYVQIAEIEMFTIPPVSNCSFTTRLLTGGVSSSDTDNEWDNIIVNSNLGGAITPGDDNIWHWNISTRSWTSSSYDSNIRATRGWTSIDDYSPYTTNTTNQYTGFRPILLVESLTPPGPTAPGNLSGQLIIV